MRLFRHRFVPFDPVEAALIGAVLATSLFVGSAVGRAGGTAPLSAIGVVAVAGAVVLFSLPPQVLFLAWFAIAPLLQESASYSTVGHALGLALYFAPSLVLAIWTLTRRAQWIRPRFLDVLPLAYLLYVLGSLVVAGDVTSTLVKGVYMTVGIGVVLYYFFALGPIGSLSTSSIAAVVLVVTLTEGGMSIIDGLTGWNLWHDTGWQQGQSRAVATLANPAALGTFLGIGIVLAVGILVWNGPPQLRKLAILALVVGVPGLYFTLTRGPIIGTVLGIFLVLVSRTKTRILAVALCVLAAVTLVVSWNKITNTTVYRQRVTNSVNVQVRFALEHQSWELVKQKPIYGWGYNAFDEATNSTGLNAVQQREFGGVSTSHNTYLTVLVDYGIIGFLLLLLPWVVISWGTFKETMHRRDLRWFTTGALAGLLVYVVANNAGDFKYFSFVSAAPWALLGILRRHQLAES